MNEEYIFENGSRVIYRESVMLDDGKEVAVYEWQGESFPSRPFSHGYSAMLYKAGNALLKINFTSDYSTGKRVSTLRYSTYEEVVEVARVLHAANQASKYTNKLLGIVKFPHTTVRDPQSKSKDGQPAWAVLIEIVPHVMLLADYIKQNGVERKEETEKDLLVQALNIGSKLYRHGVNFDNEGSNNILVDSQTRKVYFVDLEHWVEKETTTEEEYLDYVGEYVKECLS